MEKELKLKILDVKDYEKIVRNFENQSDISIQENYYYDTEDMVLLKNDSVLRARIEKGKVLITFKNLKNEIDGYFISEEIEDMTSYEEFQDVLSGKKCILDLCFNCKKNIINKIKDGKLVLIGKIENERRAFYYKGIRIELDKVNFGKDIVDFEMEAETEFESEARKKLIELLKDLNVKYQIQKRTKYQRFLELNKIKIPFGNRNSVSHKS